MIEYQYKPIIWDCPNYLRGVRNLTCVRCGQPNAVACHYTGMRQHWYGKGRGIKCSDLMTADLCNECHLDFDQFRIESLNTINDRTIRKIAYSEEFLHLITLTIHRRLELGHVLQFKEQFFNTLPI